MSEDTWSRRLLKDLFGSDTKAALTGMRRLRETPDRVLEGADPKPAPFLGRGLAL